MTPDLRWPLPVFLMAKRRLPIRPCPGFRRLTVLFILIVSPHARGQSVIPELDGNETPGKRPYEMVLANRKEPAPPSLRFDQLQGWRIRVWEGAQATLQASRAQNVWDRAVGRLRYRGNGNPASEPRVVIYPSRIVLLPSDATCVDMWVYGNRWALPATPKDTPSVQIHLFLRDVTGKTHDLLVERITWEEWWLLHHLLPKSLRFPAVLDRMEITGGWQKEWRDLFFDSIRFYREPMPPLQFAPRARRNLTLFGGQSPGVNTGSDKLPFPTREETILPAQLGGPFRNEVTAESPSVFVFKYIGQDCAISYFFEPAKGLSPIRAQLDGTPAATFFDRWVLRKGNKPSAGLLRNVARDRDVVVADYSDGTRLQLRIWQKSLVADVINRSGQVTELEFGRVVALRDSRTIWIPFITYGATNPCVALSKAGTRWVFISQWLDWYRSNASEPYGAEYAGPGFAVINGGVRYKPRTDGQLNPVYERIFLTVSPALEEVLPTIPNPVGLHAPEAVDRLCHQSKGPENYAGQMKYSRKLRAYGIEKVIQCNHELTWRDAGESFTLRKHAAPNRGGDDALTSYVAHQRSLGWLSGLYTNYTDFAPVNEYWNPNLVTRTPENEWKAGWFRCYNLKPLYAVMLEASLAPYIKAKYRSNAAYTDVHTAIAPWAYEDYDARVPGAATFAQTFYAYGELLRNDSRVYDGPVFSEGPMRWLYAGLTDGNYAQTAPRRPLVKERLLPVFDLYQIHTKECDIGMAWTSSFCEAIPAWRAPQNLDNAIDRFLLYTLAYGHIGWLLEEEHGIGRICRSYYMLQQVQTRYGLKAPSRIAYWDGKKTCSVSEAVALDLDDDRRQLYVEYPGGLQLWFNDHPDEDWRVRVGTQDITLPPAGWAAWQSDDSLLSYSALLGGGKADYLRSPAYIYLDGRGQWFSTPEAGADGALAISPLSQRTLQVVRISGKEPFVIRRPYGVQGEVTLCETYDVEGRPLAKPITHECGEETWIEPVANAVRYVLLFSGKPTWSIAPAQDEAVAGGAMPMKMARLAQVTWQCDKGEVRNSQLLVPRNLPVGTWIKIRGTVGDETHETRLRVCSPVYWRSRVVEHYDDTHLFLTPSWNLKGLNVEKLDVVLKAPDGWQANTDRFPINTRNLPQVLEVRLLSSAPSGKEGNLEVALNGLPQPSAATFRLRRVQQQPLIADLRDLHFSWGIARRREPERPALESAGAAFYFDNDFVVGRVSKRGFFIQPPYSGGVGYTWAETEPIKLPTDPCQFRAFVGVKDSDAVSDGMLFRVEVVDARGNRRRVAEQMGYQDGWRLLTADLAPFADQLIQIRLIGDVGPKDNHIGDQGAWGEPIIQLSSLRTLTEASLVAPAKP